TTGASITRLTIFFASRKSNDKTRGILFFYRPCQIVCEPLAGPLSLVMRLIEWRYSDWESCLSILASRHRMSYDRGRRCGHGRPGRNTCQVARKKDISRDSSNHTPSLSSPL